MRFEVEHGALDHCFALTHSFAVHGVTFFKKGSAIDHEIRFGDDLGGVLFGDIFADSFNLDTRIQLAQSPSNRLDARLADPIVRHQQLSVQVAGFE